jgi:flagellar basal-body rod protein FlgC
MGFLRTLDISASGLFVQRKIMDVIASNLANMETTRTEKGGPYRRKMVVLRADPSEDFSHHLDLQMQSVRLEGIVEDKSPLRQVYDPAHPDADKEGYLFKPNVDLVVEMTNMLIARRVFEANVAAMKTTRQMTLKALEVGR